ncbi:helix-turn-helix transcriptional regulator [Nocardia otitidiscaviarum]|uniref:helix-turn-helix transcriptional regulator n=1 Tax=Nocardia otitidiscaviarum TaxID=1823 RepID=UPI0018952F11|nr:helix-turn-helix transcriptional regulator [Nocardia otitidiscaviarum]MBF6236647.1 helix-turn-helix transcriptional regulator [Nocardia otitidiscaviarum]
MANDRLREALARNGLTTADIAEKTEVDEKTVERWITTGRTPYPRHRRTITALVRESENYLWPDAVPAERRAEAAEAEVIKVYPHRNSIPADLWVRLLNSTAAQLDILVLAGLFLTEEPSFGKMIRQKTREGLKVRMLFGDPTADEAKKRSAEERLASGTVSARIKNALALIEPLSEVDGVEVRFHETTLYNSIFRFDDEMIVNAHVYGLPGAHAPALHLRRLPTGDLFETYTTSFEHVWNGAHPANFGEVHQ